MPIIQQKTQAEADESWLESLILRKAEAMHHYASVSKSVNDEFWCRDKDDILRILNADIQRSLTIMSSDLGVNIPVNDGLQKLGLPQFSKRAPVEAGRSDIVFDGEKFVYVAPPVVEPPAIDQPVIE